MTRVVVSARCQQFWDCHPCRLGWACRCSQAAKSRPWRTHRQRRLRPAGGYRVLGVNGDLPDSSIKRACDTAAEVVLGQLFSGPWSVV